MVDATSLILLAAGAGEAAEPSSLGLTAPMWVALSMAVLILIGLFLNVPKMLTKGLDAGIFEIKQQLDEARALREEAEALRQEYADKIAGAEKDAAAMLDHARHEAGAIVAKAEADTAAVITRREKMATDKIAAAENAALAELRAQIAEAASTAARGLIAANFGAEADTVLIEKAIQEV